MRILGLSFGFHDAGACMLNGDQIEFATKSAEVSTKRNAKPINQNQILSQRKPILLALNIPTIINLYGYGYRHVYELNELINVKDSRVKFEGTEIK